jgi:phosphoglycerate dehydrogenase-like enzyme
LVQQSQGSDIVALTVDGTPITEAVARWFDDRDVPWAAFDRSVESPARVLVAGGFGSVGVDELAVLPELELVVRTGAGYEHVDLATLESSNVALVAPRLTDDPSVPEFVIGSVLALLRGTVGADSAVRRGDWGFRDTVNGGELAGRTFGVVGFGRIGSQVARLAASFGSRVVVWHPWSVKDIGTDMERVASIEELLETSDIVSLHCRLQPSTRNLIDAAAVQRMRSGAILVNTARGEMIDEEAVVDACRNGRLAGAVIDTFRGEPNPDTSLFRGDTNILLSPHIAGLTRESVDRLAAFVASACCEYLRHSELPEDHLVGSSR